ncbi:MAG TPA: hypothetical protein V6D25_23780 [Leptolyngbyaceae cyanobacterium]
MSSKTVEQLLNQLKELLIKSKRTSEPKRETLATDIGINSGETPQFMSLANDDLAKQIVDLLWERQLIEKLLKLCEILQPDFEEGEYSSKLKDIATQLQSYLKSKNDSLQPTSEGYKKTKLYETLEGINTDESRLVKDKLAKIFEKLQSFLSSTDTERIITNNFTLYDPERGDRVAQRVVDVISPELLSQENNENKLSAWELGLLLLSVYLLDVCLTPKMGKVALYYNYLLKGEKNLPSKATEYYTLSDEEIKDFQIWLSHLEHENNEIEQPLLKGELDIETKRQCERLVTYYCRKCHIDWTKYWINNYLSECLFYKNSNDKNKDNQFIEDLILLCSSPYCDEVKSELKDEGKPHWRKLDFNQKTIEIRMKYLMAVLRTANSLAFDPVCIPDVIWQDYDMSSDKLIHWWEDEQETIIERAKDQPQIKLIISPKKALIHHAILTVADEIDSVLTECYKLFEGTSIQALWDLHISIDRDIRPKDNYEYINGTFRVETKKILDLLSGTELYGNPLYAVRELLQNAFDAVRERIAYERLELYNKNSHRDDTPQRLAETYSVDLEIKKDPEGYWLICRDKGVGMSKEIIQNNLLVGGISKVYGRRKLEHEAQEKGFSVGITGQFGIGALSYFMLAKKVKFITHRNSITGNEEKSGWQFTTEGLGLFGELRKDNIPEGTEVSLLLKKDIIAQVIKENEYEEDKEQTLEESIGEFVDKLKSFLQGILCHIPCKFTFTTYLSDPKIQLNYKLPGWVPIEDINVISLKTVGIEYKNLVEGYKQALEESKFGSLKWDTYTQQGQISIEESGRDLILGDYRIHLPYFELNHEKSLAYLYYEGNELLLKEKIIERRSSYDSKELVHGEQIKFKNLFFSWKGMYVETYEDSFFDGLCLVEINLTYNLTGKLKANRNNFEFNELGNKALEYVENKCKEIINGFLRENDKSLYALLNYRLTSIPFSKETILNWLAVNGKQLKMQPLTFPLLVPSTYEFSTKLVYQGVEININTPCFSINVSKGYSDRDQSVETISWIDDDFPFFSDRVVARYLSEEEMKKFSINPEQGNIRLSYLFTDQPPQEVTQTPVGITSLFPEQWGCTLSCVETKVHFKPSSYYEYEFSYNYIKVWNAQHPLVKAIDTDAWAWYENKWEELNSKDLKFIEKIQEIKEEIITKKSYAATFIAKFLYRITPYIVFSEEEEDKKILEEWNEICKEEHDFVEELWQLILGQDWQDKKIHICKFISSNSKETPKLIVLTPSGWNEYTKQSDVNEYLPVLEPGSKWRLEVQQSKRRTTSETRRKRSQQGKY